MIRASRTGMMMAKQKFAGEEAMLLSGVPTCSQARRASIYSLTLDELRNIVGERGKNMEEFLSSICPAHENSRQSTSAEAANRLENGDADVNHKHRFPVQSGMCHDDGLGMILPPVFRMSVEEVCANVQTKEQRGKGDAMTGIGTPEELTCGANLENMAMEDFLMKAGVVGENAQLACSVPLYKVGQEHAGGVNFGRLSSRTCASGPPVLTPVPIQRHPELIGPTGLSDGDIRTGVRETLLASSPSSEAVRNGEYGSPRICHTTVLDGKMEKVVDRRQRRMIKNRESAARSRARKQAYTVELETELHRLKEENTTLKKEREELERRMRRRIEAIKRLQDSVAAPTNEGTKEKKLGRVNSWPLCKTSMFYAIQRSI